MTDEGTDPESNGFRFGIGTLMLVTFVFGIMGAAGRQFVLAVHQGSSPRALFVIFTLAAPMLALVLLRVSHQVVLWMAWRSNQHRNENEVRIDS